MQTRFTYQMAMLLCLCSFAFCSGDSYAAPSAPTHNDACVDDLAGNVSGANSKSGIKMSILVHASAANVWHAICDNRDDDPDVKYSKITKINDTAHLLEQKYGSIPFFGSTTCVLHIEEEPFKRIDYKLVRSDSLSHFSGTWHLTPCADGKSTMVEVSNQIKLKFPLPQKLVDGFARHKLKSRAMLVKNSAEAAELHLVDAGTASVK